MGNGWNWFRILFTYKLNFRILVTKCYSFSFSFTFKNVYQFLSKPVTVSVMKLKFLFTVSLITSNITFLICNLVKSIVTFCEIIDSHSSQLTIMGNVTPCGIQVHACHMPEHCNLGYYLSLLCLRNTSTSLDRYQYF